MNGEGDESVNGKCGKSNKGRVNCGVLRGKMQHCEMFGHLKEMGVR